MTSNERIEREAAGYFWSANREVERLDRLSSAWDVIMRESSFPFASIIASYYGKKLNKVKNAV